MSLLMVSLVVAIGLIYYAAFFRSIEARTRGELNARAMRISEVFGRVFSTDTPFQCSCMLRTKFLLNPEKPFQIRDAADVNRSDIVIVRSEQNTRGDGATNASKILTSSRCEGMATLRTACTTVSSA